MGTKNNPGKEDLEHKIAEIASDLQVRHDCDFSAEETLNRIKEFYKEHRSQTDYWRREHDTAHGFLNIAAQKNFHYANQIVELKDALQAAVEHLTALSIMIRENTLHNWNSAGTVATIQKANELLHAKDTK